MRQADYNVLKVLVQKFGGLTEKQIIYYVALSETTEMYGSKTVKLQ